MTTLDGEVGGGVAEDLARAEFDAGWVAATEVAFDRDVFIWMHSDGVERTFLGTGAAAYAKLFAN